MTGKPRIALFIDAENASPEHLPAYLDHCRSLGKPTIARCYGNQTRLTAWRQAMSDHHLVPVLTPPSASKKNASDFSLTIDAVALLHRGIFDHAVIASGDGDFTQLAIHIREHGKGVDGIGRELNSGADLRQAFDNYVILSNPITKTEKPVPITKSEPAAATKSVPAQKPLSPSSIDPKQLLGFFTELTVGGKSLSVQSFGTVLTNRLGQNYKRGHGRLINYLKKSGVFDVDKGIVILTRQSR